MADALALAIGLMRAPLEKPATQGRPVPGSHERLVEEARLGHREESAHTSRRISRTVQMRAPPAEALDAAGEVCGTGGRDQPNLAATPGVNLAQGRGCIPVQKPCRFPTASLHQVHLRLRNRRIHLPPRQCPPPGRAGSAVARSAVALKVVAEVGLAS